MGTANVTSLFYDTAAPFKLHIFVDNTFATRTAWSSRMVDHLASKKTDQRASIEKQKISSFPTRKYGRNISHTHTCYNGTDRNLFTRLQSLCGSNKGIIQRTNRQKDSGAFRLCEGIYMAEVD